MSLDTPVVRHSPNDAGYNAPDVVQASKLSGGATHGFVTIPRGRPLSDGRSMGFDANIADVIHVDPHLGDGNMVVDPRQLDNQTILSATMHSQYPHEVYYRLGHSAPATKTAEALPPPQAAPLPGLPGYVVPPSDLGGVQYPQFGMTPIPNNTPQFEFLESSRMNPIAPIIPSLPSLSGLPAENPPLNAPGGPQNAPPALHGQGQPLVAQAQPPAAQGFPPQIQLAPPTLVQGADGQIYQLPAGTRVSAIPPLAPAAPPPTESPLLVQLAHNVAALAQQVNGMQRQMQTVPPLAVGNGQLNVQDALAQARRTAMNSVPEEAAPPVDARRPSLLQQEAETKRQTLSQYEESQQKPGEALIAGFETLDIAYVNGPLPQKPKTQVIFDFGQLGKTRAVYHEVIETEHSLVLVYDTRYEEGVQSMPPDRGEQPFKVIVPGSKKEYWVTSFGLNHSLGVFDQIVLVRAEQTEEEDSFQRSG